AHVLWILSLHGALPFFGGVVVGQAEGLVEVAGVDDGEDGAEDLVAVQGVVRGDAGKDVRRDDVVHAGGDGEVFLADELGQPLGAGPLDVAADVGGGLGVD